MADTSSGRLALIKETTPGIIPATPAFQVMDFTAETMKVAKAFTKSNSITGTRLTRAGRATGLEANGAINFEMVRGLETDMILTGVLGNPFAGGPPLTADGGGLGTDTYTLERLISPTMLREFTGCRFGALDLTLAPDAYVLAVATVLGSSGVTKTAPVTGAAYTPQSADQKLVSLDTTLITIGGITGTFDFEQITMKIDNQLTASRRLGPLVTRRLRAGQLLVTGQMRVYVDNNAFADAQLAETPFNFEVQIVNGTRGYGFVVQKAQITDYEDANSGNGNEFIANVGFEAVLDPSTAKQLTIKQIG